MRAVTEAQPLMCMESQQVGKSHPEWGIRRELMKAVLKRFSLWAEYWSSVGTSIDGSGGGKHCQYFRFGGVDSARVPQLEGWRRGWKTACTRTKKSVSVRQELSSVMTETMRSHWKLLSKMDLATGWRVSGEGLVMGGKEDFFWDGVASWTQALV